MSNWDLEIMDETVVERDQSDIKVEDLKKEKSKAKSAFTKTRHKLLQILDESAQRQDVRELLDKLRTAEENAMSIMDNLFEEYKCREEFDKMRKVGDEMRMESELSEAENECQDYFMENSASGSRVSICKDVQQTDKADNSDDKVCENR